MIITSKKGVVNITSKTYRYYYSYHRNNPLAVDKDLDTNNGKINQIYAYVIDYYIGYGKSCYNCARCTIIVFWWLLDIYFLILSVQIVDSYEVIKITLTCVHCKQLLSGEQNFDNELAAITREIEKSTHSSVRQKCYNVRITNICVQILSPDSNLLRQAYIVSRHRKSLKWHKQSYRSTHRGLCFNLLSTWYWTRLGFGTICKENHLPLPSRQIWRIIFKVR